MKKFCLALSFAWFTASVAHAQTFSCVLLDDSVAFGPPINGNELVIDAEFTNLTSQPLLIEIARLSNDLPPNWLTYFCLDQCFPPNYSLVTTSVGPGPPSEFCFHFVVSSVPDSGIATIRLKDVNGGPGDVWYQTYIGVTLDSLTRIVALARPEVSIGPSPALAGTPLQVMARNLGQNAQLILTDVNGEWVKTVEVREGMNEVTTADLSPGLYLYLITSTGRSPASGKISIVN